MQVIFAAKTVERRGAHASALTLTHSHVGPVALDGRALGGPLPGLLVSRLHNSGKVEELGGGSGRTRTYEKTESC